MKRTYQICFVLFIFLYSMPSMANKKELIYPYVLSDIVSINNLPFAFGQVLKNYRTKISQSPFELLKVERIGLNHAVLILTSKALNSTVSKERYGGLAATINLAIVKYEEQIEISFTNPVFLSHAYHFKKDQLTGFASLMKKHFGFKHYFGKGYSSKALRNFLVFSRQKKNSLIPIPDGKSRASIISTIENGLNGNPQISTAYKINLKNKRQTVIGLRMNSTTDDYLNDQKRLERIDSETNSRVSALPMNIVVDGHAIIAVAPSHLYRLFFNGTSVKENQEMLGSFSFLFNSLTQPSQNIVLN